MYSEWVDVVLNNFNPTRSLLLLIYALYINFVVAIVIKCSQRSSLNNQLMTESKSVFNFHFSKFKKANSLKKMNMYSMESWEKGKHESNKFLMIWKTD